MPLSSTSRGARLGVTLELLPDVFTVEDAKRVRRQQGMAIEKTGNMISTWKKRDYVVQMADGSFK